MSRATARGYARSCAALAAAVGALLLLVGWPRGASFVGWSLLGWGFMAGTAVIGGAWTAARHGTSGAGFLVALQTCILARLALAVGGAVVAMLSAEGAIRAYLVGLVAGFVPLQVFEVVWFFRRTGSLRSAAMEPGGGPPATEQRP
jgi:hypothetical protein